MMETLPITLIVKAPNQQIEDQTIKCELSWTIHKLKLHLSEVYPSKPAKHEQKLIYSGQLLNDSVTLKDILRQYEGQETHTVHLVCTPPKYQEQLPKTPERMTQPVTMTTTDNNQQQNMLPQQQQEQQQQQSVPWSANQVDPNQYTMHMAWMQQAYVQYMTQYMQLAAHSYAGGAAMGQGGGGVAPGMEAPAPPEAPAPEPQPQPVPLRDQDNNAAEQRDWLDVFYTLTRVMVLFSVVYFYSSPLRFIFVLLLGFGIYLYQIGFFRNLNNNNNNNNNMNPNGTNEPVAEEQQAPSRLMVVWTFFATFFASLIPEVPNAI